MQKRWQEQGKILLASNLLAYCRHAVYWACLLTVTAASAAETGLPWEGPLEKILASLTGPIAKAVGVFSIVIAGFGVAFGESGGSMRRIFQIVLGLSIAFTASTLIAQLFGFAGGSVF